MKKVNTAHTSSRALQVGMAVSFVFLVSCAFADDLAPTTEVTARYTFASIFGQKPTATALTDTQLNAIEPASGGESAPAEGHDASAGPDKEAEGAPAEATEPEGEHGKPEDDSGHGPKASGKAEAHKSFTGKVIGATPPLPKVTIGGVPIISNAQAMAQQLKETTPLALTKGHYPEMLNRRFKIKPYIHSPQQLMRPARVSSTEAPGGILHPSIMEAPINVVEFLDLSCNQCMEEVSKIDAALQDISSTVMVTYIHAPTGQFQDTNMPAFYGKVAARAGLFWQYRAGVIQGKPADANATFQELIKSGIAVPVARSLMLNEARRFYRELDADALLARTFGIGHPPVVFVNGIKLGENGLPLELLPDVLKYIENRLNKGMAEPPQ